MLSNSKYLVIYLTCISLLDPPFFIKAMNQIVTVVYSRNIKDPQPPIKQRTKTPYKNIITQKSDQCLVEYLLNI